MPYMDGIDALREMKNDPDVKFLLISGFTGRGLAGFRKKPFQFEDLRDKLRFVLGD